MSINFSYKAGIASVGQYQMSAIPYASSSIDVSRLGNQPVEIVFPRVTKFVTIRNTVATGSSDDKVLRVGFSSIGVSGTVATAQNYFTLANQESYTGEWRIKSIFLLSDDINNVEASIIAGLTAVSTSSIDFDNWSGSLGVQ